jgi:hypothetical protein
MPRRISSEMEKFESFLIEILRSGSDPGWDGKRPDKLWQGVNDGFWQVAAGLIAVADTCGELALIFRTPAWALVRGPAAGR